MDIKNKIKTLDIPNEFVLSYRDYETEIEGSNLLARIDNITGDIEYFVVGIYNSGCDEVEIDINELIELKNLCEILVEN